MASIYIQVIVLTLKSKHYCSTTKPVLNPEAVTTEIHKARSPCPARGDTAVRSLHT